VQGLEEINELVLAGFQLRFCGQEKLRHGFRMRIHFGTHSPEMFRPECKACSKKQPTANCSPFSASQTFALVPADTNK